AHQQDRLGRAPDPHPHRHRGPVPERPLAAPQPRRSHADAEIQALRAGNAQPHGRAAKTRGLQDRRGLGPPDPFIRARPEPHQGPAHQRGNLQHPEGPGRRPGHLHPGQPEARRVIPGAPAGVPISFRGKRMTDTIAILTGASRGIGAALARGLARPGTRLITLARRADPELAAHARAQGAELEQVQVDLADLGAAAQAAERIAASLPRDAGRYLLINNAGTVQPVAAAAELVDGPAIAAAFNLNISAVMLLTARFVAAVHDLQADRRVLNISSGAGRNPNAGWGVYCATKAALDMYTRVLKQEQG